MNDPMAIFYALEALDGADYLKFFYSSGDWFVNDGDRRIVVQNLTFEESMVELWRKYEN